ncbi:MULTISPECIES: hypothetical protein [Streptomyces]|uniref:Uncharacterized protein n=1 Tax=Streptomyces evansiae TaxID=3075535 RepID=A0ABD5DZJ6_9ACTN|nr:MULTISPECIES: hypothetical protein [unclassified Streptomyces]ASY32219.1 hypothetical protein CAC01_05420 [Streptomyces sp. CLI2509]MDT0414603.1 hypothetical protein [Streptomyces sp. DSM 41982]MYX23486.1 hypothetical protein [Streptomyces sp. SID8380]SCD32964.1 hypothetical protein GA0115246_100424 [Streptomyces sp. SolWspMP-sol7th]
MLEQELLALAASGGTAVVTAVGTDAWQLVREAVARWFGRGDTERENAELERLTRTETALRQSGADDVERESMRQESAWQARMETLLEGLSDEERATAAEELRSLIAGHIPGGLNAEGKGVVVGRDLHVRADGGSAAAVNMGNVRIAGGPTPPQPGRNQEG